MSNYLTLPALGRSDLHSIFTCQVNIILISFKGAVSQIFIVNCKREEIGKKNARDFPFNMYNNNRADVIRLFCEVEIKGEE